MGGGEQNVNAGYKFEKSSNQMNLFNDQFINQYKQIGNAGGMTPNNNENLNIINSIFGNNNQPSVLQTDNERERRLKLRDQERMKR